MRFLHVISSFQVGGAETALLGLLRGNNGAKTNVIALAGGGPLLRLYEQAGIEVECLNMASSRDLPAAVRGLRHRIRELQPDVVNGWLYYGSVAAALAADRRPLVLNIRHSLDALRKEKLHTLAGIAAAAVASRRARFVVYNSDASRTQHERVGYAVSNARVIPNGIDTDRFRPSLSNRACLRASLGISTSTTLFGLIGRYHPAKGFPVFIRAAAQIARAHADVAFLFAGRGTDIENSELVSLIRKAGLDINRCHLLGERTDMPQVLTGLDYLVSASITESFPNIVGEAMASGVLPIATAVGDSRKIVGNSGWVCPPSDFVGLAAAMEQALALPEQAAAQRRTQGRDRVVTNYGLSRVIGEFSGLWQAAAA